MTVNHPPIQSGLPFLKSIQVNDEVDFNFINKNQLNLYPNHCQVYEYDNFDRTNPLNDENHLQNYHFLQFKCNSSDFFPNDVNLLLHYQNQHQHLLQQEQQQERQQQQQQQESSMPSPPSTSTSKFNEPDQIDACNLNQFSPNPALLHNMQSIPGTQPTHPSHPAQSISQLRLQTITPELEKLPSSYPIPSLNSSPISHSSSISFDQIHPLDLKPNLDDFNSTLLHQSQPLQSPLSPHQYNLSLHSQLNSFQPYNSNFFDQNQSFQAQPNAPIPNQYSNHSHPKPQTRIKSNQETQYKTKIQTQRTKSNQSQVQPEKKYGCLICNKHFARAFNLQTHIATHKGIKPFKCPTPNCSKSFSRRHDLSRHLNSLHSDWLNSLKVNSNQIVSKLKLDDHDKLLFKTCSNYFQI